MFQKQHAYAKLQPRFVAAVIDYILLILFSAIIDLFMAKVALGPHVDIQALFGHFPGSHFVAHYHDPRFVQMVILRLMTVIMGTLFYFIPFETSKWQGTPGKRLMGLRVTDTEEAAVTMSASMVRNLVKGMLFFAAGMVSFGGIVLLLLVLWMMSESGGYRLPHDYASGTIVVGKPENTMAG